MKPTVGILAVQGAFIEHERTLSKLGCTCLELRQAPDAHKSFNALVLPGGESTTQRKLLHELGMFDELKRRITAGTPVLGTCAGLILLAERLENDAAKQQGDAPGVAFAKPTCARKADETASPLANATGSENKDRHRPEAKPHADDAANAQNYPGFGTLPVTARRNAYGRQLGSFHTSAPVAGIGTVPMTFIRAPFITQAPAEDVLARVDGNIVAVRHGNQIGVAFHPELDTDLRIHQLFLSLIG